ncbi:NUDIX hydrolase [Limnoraphis robusta]|uniref:NUDIX hydrolase n=1 Tax=Limnoraphis robusta TaxID=1118279 RepID=UPI002B1F83F5|nr:NUDIX hydrolase [Limnoraphis robusta]MEA5501172.1 NUDIX hydrolase [Limnoraphis robusta BA-68 BA1]
MDESQSEWKRLDRFVEMRSAWLTVIGEHFQDDQGKNLEYWRVEKADSVVILTMKSDQFLLPVPIYRPGLDQVTLDFPGGRVPPDKTPEIMVPDILKRELGIVPEDIFKLTALNRTGWAINSSFSNQKLYGFAVQIHPDAAVISEKIGATYPITFSGINALLQDLTCLQCRAMVLEWQRLYSEQLTVTSDQFRL